MPDSRETGPHSSGANDTVSDVAPIQRSVHLDRGSLVGRYVVLEPIGSGGMSIVYAAYDPELDRRVALKVLRGSGDATSVMHERERARLLREAQAMARLTHPNVVPIYDVGSIGERVFLAMHFVEGQTLTRWLTQSRDWRQIVEFFVYAGRGLAAAHAAGLVHRDFKPDNVLVDGDGRVRVTDFGLARPSEGPRSIEESDGERPTGTASVSSARLERPVTIAGAVLGTPAYMSPEQHLAGEVDARTDQFSFCVALWEALVGERPFAGLTVGELAFAVTRGQMRTFPRESPVPNRIRRALARGLARAPEERFAAMGDLLDALAPPIRRRPALIIGAAAGLVALGATLPLFGGADEPAPDPCATARAGLDEIWDASTRARVVEAISATGRLSPTVVEDVAVVLDRRASDWRDSATMACVAHRIEGSESAGAFDARMQCLARRRIEIEESLVKLQASGSQRIDAVASDVFDGISPSECNDARRLLETVPPPEDPTVRARATEIERELEVLLGDIRSDDATLALAEALLTEAESTGWHSLISRARATKALVHEARGEIKESEAMLRAAARASAAGRDDNATLRVLGDLAFALAHLQNRVPEALEVAYLIELEITRIDGHPVVPSIFASLGAVYQGANQLDRAQEVYLKGLALLDIPGRDNPIRRTVVLNNLGTVELARGDALAARRFFEKALALAIATHGDKDVRASDHYVNLCESHIQRGEYDLARPYGQRALALVDGPRPVDAAAAARALHSLGFIDVSVGDFAAARAAIDRGRPLMIATFGEGGYNHAAIEVLDSLLHLYAGDLVGADRLAVGVDEMVAETGTPLAMVRPTLLTLHGWIALAGGKHANALRACDEALALLPPGFAADHPMRMEPLVCRGEALAALGRGDEAVTALEAAAGIYERIAGDPFIVSRGRFALAKLFAAQGAWPRARSLAQTARADLRLVTARSPTLVAAIDAWLEAHR